MRCTKEDFEGYKSDPQKSLHKIMLYLFIMRDDEWRGGMREDITHMPTTESLVSPGQQFCCLKSQDPPFFSYFIMGYANKCYVA